MVKPNRLSFSFLFAMAVVGVAILPCSYLAYQWRHLPHFGMAHDDGIYLVTARSLATEGEFRLVSIPGNPPQTKYPPLFPLYLSLAWLVQPNFPEVLP